MTQEPIDRILSAPLGSPPLHPQFMPGALFLYPSREKVHTVVTAWLKRAAVAAEFWGQPPGRKIQEAAVQIEVKDNARKWLWGFLAVLVM